MAFAPAGGEAAIGAWTLVAAFGFVVCAGQLWIWRHTIGAVFQELADFSIGIGWGPAIHPLAPLGAINHAVEAKLSQWADDTQKQFGLSLHYIAELFWVMSGEISSLSSNTLSLGHYIVHTAIPWQIKANLDPFKKKTNQAVAAAALAGIEIARLKKRHGVQEQAQAKTQAKTQTQTHQQAKDETHTKTVTHTIERTVHDTKVITQVIEVGSLPVPFGRTVKQMWRMLRRHEALFGATAMAAVMANVLGVANPRCLRDGPFGRFARSICGMPTHFLNDILGLLADFFILENICTVIPWLEDAAEAVGVPLIAGLTDITAGLCKGSIGAADPLQGPMPNVPAYYTGSRAVPV